MLASAQDCLLCAGLAACLCFFAVLLLLVRAPARPRRCYGAAASELPVRLTCLLRGVYNPSLLLDEGGEAWLAARDSPMRDGRSEVVLARGAVEQLAAQPLRVLPGLRGQVDARLFRFRGDLLAGAHEAGPAQTFASTLLSIEQGRAAVLELPEGAQEVQKNWIPIPHGEDLYWVQSLSPFRLLRSQSFDGALPARLRCEDVALAPLPRQLPRGARGSSAACVVPQGLLAAWHLRLAPDALAENLRGLGVGELPDYLQGLVLLNGAPPFLPRASTAPFRFVGSTPEAQAALGSGFHFLNGIAVAGARVFFCLGVADTSAVVVEADLDAVLVRLLPL